MRPLILMLVIITFSCLFNLETGMCLNSECDIIRGYVIDVLLNKPVEASCYLSIHVFGKYRFEVLDVSVNNGSFEVRLDESMDIVSIEVSLHCEGYFPTKVEFKNPRVVNRTITLIIYTFPISYIEVRSFGRIVEAFGVEGNLILTLFDMQLIAELKIELRTDNTMLKDIYDKYIEDLLSRDGKRFWLNKRFPLSIYVPSQVPFNIRLNVPLFEGSYTLEYVNITLDRGETFILEISMLECKVGYGASNFQLYVTEKLYQNYFRRYGLRIGWIEDILKYADTAIKKAKGEMEEGLLSKAYHRLKLTHARIRKIYQILRFKYARSYTSNFILMLLAGAVSIMVMLLLSFKRRIYWLLASLVSNLALIGVLYIGYSSFRFFIHTLDPYTLISTVLQPWILAAVYLAIPPLRGLLAPLSSYLKIALDGLSRRTMPNLLLLASVMIFSYSFYTIVTPLVYAGVTTHVYRCSGIEGISIRKCTHYDMAVKCIRESFNVSDIAVKLESPVRIVDGVAHKIPVCDESGLRRSYILSVMGINYPTESRYTDLDKALVAGHIPNIYEDMHVALTLDVVEELNLTLGDIIYCGPYKLILCGILLPEALSMLRDIDCTPITPPIYRITTIREAGMAPYYGELKVRRVVRFAGYSDGSRLMITNLRTAKILGARLSLKISCSRINLVLNNRSQLSELIGDAINVWNSTIRVSDGSTCTEYSWRIVYMVKGLNEILVLATILSLILTNTIYSLYYHRSREMRLLWILGASPTRVKAIYSIEAMLMIAPGLALGTILSFSSLRLLADILGVEVLDKPEPSWIICGMLLGTAASLTPLILVVRRATRPLLFKRFPLSWTKEYRRRDMVSIPLLVKDPSDFINYLSTVLAKNYKILYGTIEMHVSFSKLKYSLAKKGFRVDFKAKIASTDINIDVFCKLLGWKSRDGYILSLHLTRPERYERVADTIVGGFMRKICIAYGAKRQIKIS